MLILHKMKGGGELDLILGLPWVQSGLGFANFLFFFFFFLLCLRIFRVLVANPRLHKFGAIYSPKMVQLRVEMELGVY